VVSPQWRNDASPFFLRWQRLKWIKWILPNGEMRLISRFHWFQWLNWWQWGQLTDYIGIRTNGIPKLKLSCRSALPKFCPLRQFCLCGISSRSALADFCPMVGLKDWTDGN
jgi:hypothetical protein